jgi:N-ethylmaleimide reductase
MVRRHVGRVSVPSQIRGLRPLASVEMPLPGRHLLFGAENAEEAYVRSEAMDEEMIGAAVEQFATAARNAIEAGFEGVEIHGG